MARGISFLLWVVLSSIQESSADRRNLSEITYRFTNCDSLNHDGPRVLQQCLPLYERMNSPLAIPGTVFQFEVFDGSYDGAQGFRLPRDGLYNITVAGASGGEGVCNYHYGLGGVISAQVRLTTDYEYLILVGHKGTSVCGVPENADHPICQRSRPRNLTEAQACNTSWFDYSTSSVNDQNLYLFSGGGGGGGASMLYARRVSDHTFLDLPIAISPGGGGASAVLDYQFVAQSIPENFTNPPEASDLERYSVHINSHLSQYYQIWPEGTRGDRLEQNDQFSSGSGGGWAAAPFELFQALNIDGRLLMQQINFAQGGFGCSSLVSPSDFTNVFGGYGGGGGGCGSGGGGGGYTGGHVISNDPRIPGSGGDVLLFNHTALPIEGLLPPPEPLNDGDGYIEIVPSDCGCDGECVVYNETREFECLCPNDTLLAGDGSSCYQETEVLVSEEVLVQFLDSFYSRVIQFSFPVLLVGLRAEVTVEPVNDPGPQDLREECLMVLFGVESSYALLSNIVSGMGTIDTLSLYTLESGNVTGMSDLVSNLNRPMLVTGAVLVSTGNCTLSRSSIQANISIRTASGQVTDRDTAVLSLIGSRLLRTTPSEDSLMDTVIIVGAVVGAMLSVVILIVIITILGLVSQRRRKTKQRSTLLHELSIQRQQVPGTGVVGINSAYFAFQEGNDPYLATSLDHTYETITINYTAEAVVERRPHSNQGPNTQFEPMNEVTTPQVDFCTFNRQRSTEDWSYPRSKLVYMKELGEGQFGKVLLMKATDIAGYKGTIPVAVKTLSSKDPNLMRNFRDEAELMKKFSHPNIVSLLGYTEPEEGEESAPLMVLEYMQYGDLHGFLVKNRPRPNRPSFLKKLHFYTFSYDIAQGLAFLSSQKYVHRDIAARNCLVGSGLQIKIADFGLARGVNNKDYYKIAGSAVLPIRWMSPESLLMGKFTSASDVWAYGVVVWEILMFGQLPLPEKNNQQVIKLAQQDRLEHSRPQHAPEELCRLMARCHQLNAEDRPSFEEIVEMELFNVVRRRPPLPSAQSTETQEPNESSETQEVTESSDQ